MASVLRTWSVVAWAACVPAGAAYGAALTVPGDCNLDWSTDLTDWVDFHGCLSGPEGGVGTDCACADLDADGDVDLADVAAFQTAFTGTQFLSFRIEDDADDGTEVNDSVWHENGCGEDDRNYMGAAAGDSYDVGLRFQLPQVSQGEEFVYARLVFPATGDGQVDSVATLRIVGVDQDSPGGFDVLRPSELPKTEAAVDWDLTCNWPQQTGHFDGCPLFRYSPDISPIINEILSRPGWGGGPSGPTLAVVIEDDACSEANFLAFQDHHQIDDWWCTGTLSVGLELYRTVRSTFVGRELLGRPTDQAVTVNALSLLALEVYFEFGTEPGVYTGLSPLVAYSPGVPVETVMDGLWPNTRYFYRMRYRRPGDSAFAAGPERTFHTQRPPGAAFSFTLQADSHLAELVRQCDSSGQALYSLALQNAFADDPDFHMALGDTFFSEMYVSRDVLDLEEAVGRHLGQRAFLDRLCHSAPFFFVLGNHEGEQGWRLDGTGDNVAVWATQARKLIYPLPSPDGFYTGSTDDAPFVGLRENYYAWEWGDALFVVLDPFWYTASKPHDRGGSPGSGDNWDWTLGLEQYTWLQQTLASSSATFKFVFSHHVTGGVTTYGRGGVEAARHSLGGRGSFEWGGEDLAGDDVFDEMRPGWGQPIHEVMVDNEVTVFFHGHDHVFVKQELDGIVYQECPQPSDANYGAFNLFYWEGRYFSGDKVNSSGHLRVTVAPSQVTVDYVRAYLPGDGANGEVAYSYAVPAPPR